MVVDIVGGLHRLQGSEVRIRTISEAGCFKDPRVGIEVERHGACVCLEHLRENPHLRQRRSKASRTLGPPWREKLHRNPSSLVSLRSRENHLLGALREGGKKELRRGDHTGEEVSQVETSNEDPHIMGTLSNMSPTKGWMGRSMPFSKATTKILLSPRGGASAHSVTTEEGIS
ncbi:hypothetical protein LIER_18389 [Lithospermum erythrorhizon]|uniref:Uncharacterized protein n=1 Tax=Lithospermum erythrorhizon TaxID=34254 RepID=A0AAV3QHY5_LITER